MRYLLVLLLLFCFTCPVTAQVTNAEYFIDTDPGYGTATPLSLTPGNDVTKDFTLALSSTAAGFHVVGLRVKDAQGRWSQTYSHTFYVVPGKAASITASEYFINTDPGYGNATTIPVAVGSDSVVNYVVPLTAYSPGFHTIGLRSKDNLGIWSQTYQHVFYVNENNALVNIDRLQYYFTGTGATDSVYTYNVPTPATSVDLNFTADLSSLVGDREYEMHIWAVNANGVRSEVLMKKIKVCSGEPAKANFDFIPLGTQVSFIDSSRGARKYKWDFGDGKIDSVSNPVHNYNAGGNYNVRLIVSNFCNADTILRQVNVLSLQSMFPNKGGNTGSVTVSILGGGFTDSSQIRLTNNGTEVIGQRVVALEGGKILQATFDLTGRSIQENWILKVINQNNIANLNNAFSTVSSTNKSLTIDVIGRDVIRNGIPQDYEIKISNSGNNDARGVMVWMTLPPDSKVVPKNFKLLVDSNIIKMHEAIDSASLYESVLVDSLFDNPNEKALLTGWTLNNIPAQGSITLKVEATINSNIGNQAPLRTWVSSALAFDGTSRDAWECLAGRLKLVSLVPVDFDPLDVPGCVATIIKNSFDIYDIWNSGDFERKKEFYRTLDIVPGAGPNIFSRLDSYDKLLTYNYVFPTIGKIGGVMWECVSFWKRIKPLQNFGATFHRAQKLTKLNIANAKASRELILSQALNLSIEAREASEYAIEKCDAWQRKVASAQKNIRVVGSFDPNEKIGPKGTSISNYNQGASPFSYKIYFENKNTATAPAQEVIILDTLDKTKFDLTTFQLKSFGFGDSVNTYVPAGLPFYATNTLLRRPGKPDLLVRTDAKLDTATGILKWRFLSLDPQTREFIDDPLDGFLPPNVTSPQGEGFISYSVMPKATLPHGTEIKNKATIYFDNNAPITTNEFLNTIDKVKPVSAVAGIPAEVYDTTFTVQWNGTDNGAGVRSYDVYYKVNNGAYKLWQYDVSHPENLFPGQKDSTYSFFSIAKDYAGNIEGAKTNAERVVTVRIFDSADVICAGSNVTFKATPASVGFTYQWQVNTGTGFVDVTTSAAYIGINTTQLTLITPPTSHAGYKYRCKISNGVVTYYSSLHAVKFVTIWLGTAGTAWETPANWSCGLVPDEHTDVIIPKVVPATPIVNADAACKTLTMNNESNLRVKSGVQLFIAGKQ